jgi:hypothetical protein
MKWSNDNKVMFVRIGIVAVVVLGGGSARADFTFGTPIRVLNAYTFVDEWASSISSDGLSLYFTSEQPGGSGDYDIWVTTRARISDPWGQPVNLGFIVNSSAAEMNPSISSDGLSLYFSDGAWIFSRPRPGGFGQADLWVTTRSTLDDDWGPPVNLGSLVNSVATEGVPSISSDNLSLFFESNRPGGSGSNDIWVTNRTTPDAEWGTPVNLGRVVNSAGLDVHVDISADGLALFFQSDRSGSLDLWLTRRTDISHPFGLPVRIGPMIKTSGLKEYPNISTDGQTLFFSSSTNWDLWQVPIFLIVDFNDDANVDEKDILTMAQHWCENYPLCDIGPMPWGDGIVDVQDLVVLAEYIEPEIRDPALIAHWKLDEKEGIIARDSAGFNDGTLADDPVWQPDTGQVDGALAFDGVDDYVSTPAILNPADGDFSVFVWIRGGAPGQVILSQEWGVNWLMSNFVDGVLKTDLKKPGTTGRNISPPGPSLTAQTIVTNGDWHRIGFVRDSSNRILYMDGIEVARDTATNLEPASGSLYIGTGCGLESGSFFSGLIDDVRIYNVALSAEEVAALAQ